MTLSLFRPWACKRKGLPCISLSHQCAVLNENAPPPASGDPMGKLVLQRYAPVTAAYGFHFKAFAEISSLLLSAGK